MTRSYDALDADETPAASRILSCRGAVDRFDVVNPIFDMKRPDEIQGFKKR